MQGLIKEDTMAQYAYPAILTPEDNWYIVTFPDFDDIYTDGTDIANAIFMANDVLPLRLMDYEDDERPIPRPSKISDISHRDDQIVTLICADTTEYRKKYDNKAVKKTLTIPNWLNTLAEKNNINFSNVLQNALMDVLKVAK